MTGANERNSLGDYWPTLAEYLERIVPHLKYTPRFPAYFDECDYHEFLYMIHELTVKKETSWRIESALFDEFGTENYDWRTVTNIVSSGCHAYSILKQCSAEGRKQVRGMTPYNGCLACAENIQGRVFYVEALLGDYEKNSPPSARLLPHIHCAHAHADGGGWCRCIWTMGPTPPAPGVSPKFMKYLDDLEAQHAISPGPGGPRNPPEPWEI